MRINKILKLFYKFSLLIPWHSNVFKNRFSPICIISYDAWKQEIIPSYIYASTRQQKSYPSSWNFRKHYKTLKYVLDVFLFEHNIYTYLSFNIGKKFRNDYWCGGRIYQNTTKMALKTWYSSCLKTSTSFFFKRKWCHFSLKKIETAHIMGDI